MSADNVCRVCGADTTDDVSLDKDGRVEPVTMGGWYGARCFAWRSGQLLVVDVKCLDCRLRMYDEMERVSE